MTQRTSLIHITTLHRDPDSPQITGFQFVTHYNDAQARATIQVEHVSLDQQQPDTFRSELRRLAHSLLEAAQSPQGILWHLPDAQ